MFLHIISLEERDMMAAYMTVRQELLAYDSAFADKKHCLVLTKNDLCEDTKHVDALRHLGVPMFIVSSVTHEGIECVIEHVFKTLEA